MKKIFSLLVIALLTISCKTDSKKEVKEEKFPKELSKVLEKHGGINAWRKTKNIVF